jgi:hypothetical protein
MGNSVQKRPIIVIEWKVIEKDKTKPHHRMEITEKSSESPQM